MVPFRVIFIRVPYKIGDLKRDPNLENYPCGGQGFVSLFITGVKGLAI